MNSKNLSVASLFISSYLDQSGIFASLQSLWISNSRLNQISTESCFAVGCIKIDVKNSEFVSWYKSGVINERETVIGSCEFNNVVFSNLTDTRIFYVENTDSSLKITRCRFDSIIISSNEAVIAVASCDTVWIHCSCFHFCCSITWVPSFCFLSYKSESVFNVSVNRTSEYCCGLGKSQWSSYAGGIKSFTYFYNNHTSTKVSIHRSGICLVKYPADVEVACFCRSMGGIGDGVFSIWGYQSGEMLATNFDIINHTVSENMGLMELYYNFKAKLTNFNFVLNSKRDWLSFYGEGTSSVTLANCFIIGDHPGPSNRVIEESVIEANRVVTNRVILPMNSICPLNRIPDTRLFSIQFIKMCTLFSLLLRIVLKATSIIIALGR